MIKAQTDGHIIREYSNWDEDFQQKMINEYNPEAHSAIPLMPRITVDKFVDPIAQNLIDKLFKKERKEKVTFMVSFGNGRHRLNLFRHLGAKSLPFQMTKESADTLNEMLEDTVCKIQL
ncbi:MAG: hypothetical protein HRT53_16490 [Colwellia sp.]|nr:hypothetical protein [Colwellia sp.]